MAYGLPPQRSLPQFLTSPRLGIYEDEHHKLWMVAKLESCSYSPVFNRLGSCLTVYLWQMTRFPQEPIPSSSTNFNCLPRTWRLDSMNTYWGTDSMLWRILDHSQFGDTEQLVLMLM
ncbi:T-cell leukemia/lymphoma protein 1B [Mastomys coucha]|uniref:T-cell leukemia/lymphoma protein 1B n=1 Tax=Mastomys coucha TaxID=35658 RepID=UPI001261C654|nr:T-cell leukemia/lymphoma protein 1B [Mastomys coucha]